MQVLVVLSPNVIQAAMYWCAGRHSCRVNVCTAQQLVWRLCLHDACFLKSCRHSAGRALLPLPSLRCTSTGMCPGCRPSLRCTNQPAAAALPPSLLERRQVGLVLAFSPELTRGRRMLRGWVITVAFACADLFALT